MRIVSIQLYGENTSNIHILPYLVVSRGHAFLREWPRAASTTCALKRRGSARQRDNGRPDMALLGLDVAFNQRCCKQTEVGWIRGQAVRPRCLPTSTLMCAKMLRHLTFFGRVYAFHFGILASISCTMAIICERLLYCKTRTVQ